MFVTIKGVKGNKKRVYTVDTHGCLISCQHKRIENIFLPWAFCEQDPLVCILLLYSSHVNQSSPIPGEDADIKDLVEKSFTICDLDVLCAKIDRIANHHFFHSYYQGIQVSLHLDWYLFSTIQDDYPSLAILPGCIQRCLSCLTKCTRWYER